MALPDSVAGAPRVESLLSPPDRQFLEGGMSGMLLSDLEFLQAEDHGRPIVPYMDQVLAKTLGDIVILFWTFIDVGWWAGPGSPAKRRPSFL